MSELNLEYLYSRQRYGVERENSSTTTTYRAAWAWYLFNSTALELNYSESEQINNQKEQNALSGTTVTITGYTNKIVNTVYGVGLRQALAPKGSRFRPSISLGYAKQFVYDRTDYSFSESTSGSTFSLQGDPEKSRDDSIFGTFNLTMGITQRISLSGSVKTVFPAFDFDKARDYVQYTLGISVYL
jgi:hypothetical protein